MVECLESWCSSATEKLIALQVNLQNSFLKPLNVFLLKKATLQIYTAGNGTHVKNVKVISICRRYYNVEV